MRKQYSAEFKGQVVKEVLKEERTLNEIASGYGVHPNQVRQWRDKALAALPGIFARNGEAEAAEKAAAQEQQVHELYAEIGRLTTELGWLKKKLVSLASRSERQTLVEWENQEMTIRRQAELLGLNRTSLYYQPVGVCAETVKLRHRIDEIYTAWPFYGYRRITAQLQREGQQVNHKAVARPMHAMGLAGIAPGPTLSQRHPAHPVYPYLLRGVTAAHPNHIWGIDLTYIRLHAGWMYLVAVLDWFSRYVVSWALDQTLAIGFVLEAVEHALGHAAPVIWNSDQGSHFTSPQYTTLLLDASVQISMDGRGRALDNVFTERLWRTVKYEEVYLNDYATPRQARLGLTRYFEFYNGQRPHQSLGYRTPAEVYCQKGEPSTLNPAIFLS